MLTIHHLKGSMCTVCKHRDRDCSSLKFNEMKLLKQYSKANDPNVFKVVKCNEFSRN